MSTDLPPEISPTPEERIGIAPFAKGIKRSHDQFYEYIKSEEIPFGSLGKLSLFFCRSRSPEKE